MPRARWFVVGLLVMVALVGGALNERGPFGPHPSLSYARFLADVQAGGVEQMVQWRDQLEVTTSDGLVTVAVPAHADLTADLGRARWAGGVGVSLASIPDAWLGLETPAVPILILVAGALIWATGVARNRRAASGPA